MLIKARTKNHPDPVSAEYDIPADLEGKVSKFGADVVNSAAEDSIVISVQAFMRRMIEGGKSVAEITAAVAGFALNTRNMVRQTAFEKVSSNVEKLSPEERKALLEKLQGLG